MADKDNQNNQNNQEKKIEQFISGRVDNLSEGAKLAIGMCTAAFHYGGAWGFLRSNKPLFREQIEAFKEEHKNIRLYKVSNGALIHAHEEFLANAVNALLPNAIGSGFAAKAVSRRKTETERFKKYISNTLEGKSPHVQVKNGFYELQLGVYSINETHSIRLNGVEYPAYKLTIHEALDIVDKLSKERNLQSEVFAITDTGERLFAPIFNTMTNNKGVQAVFRGLSISDTDTGVFVTIHIKKR